MTAVSNARRHRKVADKIPDNPMCHNAYFISPEDKIIPVPMRHIDLIDANPELFGLKEKYLDRIYEKHEEARGSECSARREFLKKIKDSGWIRVRIVFDVTTGKYVINFDLNKYTDSAKERIARFLRQMKLGKIQSAEYWIRNPDVKIWNECKGQVF
ncbi:MAG: hypothetical protein WC637_17480 [Victivallales bacterium]|jgi:hypothetical protein